MSNFQAPAGWTTDGWPNRMSVTAHTVEELKLVELDSSKQYVVFVNPIMVDILALAETVLPEALNGAPIIPVKVQAGQSLDDAIAIREKVSHPSEPVSDDMRLECCVARLANYFLDVKKDFGVSASEIRAIVQFHYPGKPDGSAE